jgi:DNA-binding NarL/FixJ family response regulator
MPEKNKSRFPAGKSIGTVQLQPAGIGGRGKKNKADGYLIKNSSSAHLKEAIKRNFIRGNYYPDSRELTPVAG